MEGRRPIAKRRRRRYRCRNCGKPATYVRKDGSEAADKDHNLCAACFAKAQRAGTAMGKRLLRESPIDGGDGGQAA